MNGHANESALVDVGRKYPECHLSVKNRADRVDRENAELRALNKKLRTKLLYQAEEVRRLSRSRKDLKARLGRGGMRYPREVEADIRKLEAGKEYVVAELRKAYARIAELEKGT